MKRLRSPTRVFDFLTDYRQLESQESAAIEAARQELELRLNRSAANVAENSWVRRCRSDYAARGMMPSA